MAKFNKDTFLNDITAKVQSAIDKNLITQEDVENNELERLHGFIQYELLQYIEDRKFAIDVLKDFNYDEKTPWENLQTEYGTFKSLLDIALVNLWKYLTAENATQFSYYDHDNKKGDRPMLDMIHDLEDIPVSGADNSDVSGDTLYNPDAPANYGGRNTGGFGSDDASDDTFSQEEPPKRKIRLAK